MRNSDKNIIKLNEVESTNNYANQLIMSNEAKGYTVVLAQYQKKGKGQQGNNWESETGKNLLTSIILFPYFLPANKQFLISKMVSLALVDFLKNEVKGVKIKWPNDIFVQDNKIAGILIENSIKGSTIYSSILGIGLNLNQEYFFSDAPNPVSLKQLTGKQYNVEEVALEVLDLVSNWYEKLKIGNSNAIDSAYFSRLFKKEEWCIFKKQTREFEAKIIGIGEFGQLQMEDRNGNISEYMFKEIEFVVLS